MHPKLEDLLSARDGEASQAVVTHLESCAGCRAEVGRLKSVRAALRALPALPPSRDRWPELMRAARAKRGLRNRVIYGGGAALALAASLLLYVTLPARTGPAMTRPAAGSHETSARDENLARLMNESRRLEEILREIDGGGRVMDLTSASTVADLEDEIAYIDARLDHPRAGSQPRPADARLLWQQRVNLMEQLVRAHDVRPAYMDL